MFYKKVLSEEGVYSKKFGCLVGIVKCSGKECMMMSNFGSMEWKNKIQRPNFKHKKSVYNKNITNLKGVGDYVTFNLQCDRASGKVCSMAFTITSFLWYIYKCI